jgi:hypothetical protein
MFRRLISWLARREIAAAVQWERLQCSVGVRFAVNAAYLRGHTDGMNEAGNYPGGNSAAR